ncbi:hypothetical protein P7K49_040372, partial [Saguinus oedipus]
GVVAFFMNICDTVLPHEESVYSLFAFRGSDLLAWVRPFAAVLPSAVERSPLLEESLCYD